MGLFNRLAFAASLGLAAAVATDCFADALDSRLLGAWTASKSDCARLFERRGGRLTYRQPVDKFAQAAIIEPQSVTTPSNTCRIQKVSRTEGGVKFEAECQDSISYTSQRVEIKIKSGSEMVYSPTGDAALDTIFNKCEI